MPNIGVCFARESPASTSPFGEMRCASPSASAAVPLPEAVQRLPSVRCSCRSPLPWPVPSRLKRERACCPRGVPRPVYELSGMVCGVNWGVEPCSTLSMAWQLELGSSGGNPREWVVDRRGRLVLLASDPRAASGQARVAVHCCPSATLAHYGASLAEQESGR